jgi:CheY-like chemotaxis protein
MDALGYRPLPPRRLLIVGDVALSRSLMKMVLTRLGYVVTCLASGQEALVALGHTRFALALIALHLPDLPGLTLARRLRAMPEPVGVMPILLFGDAWDRESILEGCRDARLDGYLPKPISIARLVSSVCDLIQRSSSSLSSSSSHSGVPSVMPPRPTPPIALDRFQEFTDGDDQLERELSSLYLSTAGLYLEELRGAQGRPADWGRAAHALKGASANIGAREVARLAAEAERAPPSPELVERLALALDEVRRFFHERRSATASPPEAAVVG